MVNHSNYFAYIGTNSVRGSRGVYTLRIDAETLDGRVISAAPAYNAGGIAMAPDGCTVYTSVEGMTFNGLPSGGVHAYRVMENGVLQPIGGQRTYGQRTCCVAVDAAGKWVYACDFYDGDWCGYPVREDGTLGEAEKVIFPPEQFDNRRLHCIMGVGTDHVGVISLAEGALIIYDAKTCSRVAYFAFPERTFPRYLAENGKYIYALMQMPDDIYVLENRLESGEGLVELQKISVMPEGTKAMPSTSTIRVTPDGQMVLAANRDSNSISVYSVQTDGTLQQESFVHLPGNGPRDFNISRDGEIVVAALQHSDEVAVLKIDRENKTLHSTGKTIYVPSPAAVTVTGRIEG